MDLATLNSLTTEQWLEMRAHARRETIRAIWADTGAICKATGTCPEIEWIRARLYGPGVDSDVRLEVMLVCVIEALPELFWDLFHETWGVCDNTWHLRSDLLVDLRRHHAALPGPDRLGTDDRAFFDALPEQVQVFRGCSRPRVRGVSWTTDREAAVGFARGHRGISVPEAVIASAVLPKAAIFASYTERQENEIVLDPRRLRRLAVEHVG